MKRHLQCAEHAQSATNLTKYCACHEICKFKTSAETPWIASANRKTIRRQSDDHPSMKSSSRTRRFRDLTRPTSNTILYWKIQHFAFRLSPKMSPNAAPATKSQTPTSPNTAPGTKNAISCLIRVSYETSFPMRRASNVNLQPQQILRLPRNL